jgi:hypothetical protein
MVGDPPFTFVVGCGRSGTTVLRTILDAHPDLAITHEARFVAGFARHRPRYERPEGFAVDRFIDDILVRDRVRLSLDADRDGLESALAGDGSPVTDYPDAVRRVYAWYATRRGKVRYGDKMPNYVLHIPLLASMFPESRFVHIIRDGRDVALSTKALAGHDDHAVSLGMMWRSRVSAGLEAGRELGPTHYHEVRYEALIASPEEEVTGVCRFLGLEYDPSMLRFFERRDDLPVKLQSNPRHTRLAEPVSPGTRSWRTDMAPGDLAQFEAVAGDLLDELGYGRAAPAPSPAVRLRAVAGIARWHAQRARARLPGMARRAVSLDLDQR